MTETQKDRAAQFRALIDLLQSVSPQIFNGFEITRAHYQSPGFEIGVDILIPKRKTNQNRPIIVRIHGGFLITGSSLFPAWFSKWILDFAEEKDAIIISPNYRLLPEAKGRDIIEDMSNFWLWLRTGGVERHLASIKQHKLSMNLSQLLLVGESAGGYLALQSVLSQFVCPKAIIALYPMIDMTAPHYTQQYTKPVVGVSNFPNALVDDFLSATVNSTAITEADPPSRLDVAIATVQNGRFLEFLGDEPELFLLKRISTGSFPPRQGGKSLFPPLFLFHGEGDTAVPVEGTAKLVGLLRVLDPGTMLHVSLQPGHHGFDFTASTQEPWLRDGLDFITAAWLSDKSRI